MSVDERRAITTNNNNYPLRPLYGVGGWTYLIWTMCHGGACADWKGKIPHTKRCLTVYLHAGVLKHHAPGSKGQAQKRSVCCTRHGTRATVSSSSSSTSLRWGSFLAVTFSYGPSCFALLSWIALISIPREYCMNCGTWPGLAASAVSADAQPLGEGVWGQGTRFVALFLPFPFFHLFFSVCLLFNFLTLGSIKLSRYIRWTRPLIPHQIRWFQCRPHNFLYRPGANSTSTSDAQHCIGPWTVRNPELLQYVVRRM
jgi:hypothetical protein